MYRPARTRAGQREAPPPAHWRQRQEELPPTDYGEGDLRYVNQPNRHQRKYHQDRSDLDDEEEKNRRTHRPQMGKSIRHDYNNDDKEEKNKTHQPQIGKTIISHDDDDDKEEENKRTHQPQIGKPIRNDYNDDDEEEKNRTHRPQMGKSRRYDYNDDDEEEEKQIIQQPITGNSRRHGGIQHHKEEHHGRLHRVTTDHYRSDGEFDRHGGGHRHNEGRHHRATDHNKSDGELDDVDVTADILDKLTISPRGQHVGFNTKKSSSDDDGEGSGGQRPKVVIIKDMHLHMKHNKIDHFAWKNKEGHGHSKKNEGGHRRRLGQ